MDALGPDAEATAKCVRFRRFWGKRSQLRRFKDGTTCEAVECRDAYIIATFREDSAGYEWLGQASQLKGGSAPEQI